MTNNGNYTATSEINNRSLTRSKIIQNLEFINIVVKSSEATSITITNLMVVLLYFKMKRTDRSIANYLIFSQSLADLFVGLMTWVQICMQLPVVVSSSYVYVMYLLYMCMLEYSLILTLGSLLLAAIERYLCIIKPFFNKQYITKRRIIMGSFGVWTLSLIPPLTLMSLMDYQYTNAEVDTVTIYSCVFDVVMMLIIAVIVALLILSLRVSKQSCDRRMERSRSLIEKKVTVKKTIRLVTIFICMIVAYTVTFLPFACTRLLYDMGILSSLPYSSQITIFIVCNTFYKSSSLFNPLLSIAMKRDYWNVLAVTFRLEKCRQLSKSTDTCSSIRKNQIKRKIGIAVHSEAHRNTVAVMAKTMTTVYCCIN